jgi:hypothetical protein
MGHGQAVWTYRDDGKSGLAYWCELMGLAPFWAEDQITAAELLRETMAFGHAGYSCGYMIEIDDVARFKG